MIYKCCEIEILLEKDEYFITFKKGIPFLLSMALLTERINVIEGIGEKESRPVQVPKTDIMKFLSSLRFHETAYEAQNAIWGVSGLYIEGMLYRYRELGGRRDILQELAAENFQLQGNNHTHLYTRLTSGVVPWPLYTIVEEKIRLSLEQEGLPVEETDRTSSSFSSGMHGVFSEPKLVAAAAVLPLETIIEQINRYNQDMNKVTTIDLIEKKRGEKNEVVVHLRRTQKQEAIVLLDALLEQQTAATEEERREVIEAICYRDIVTTMGAFFGVNYLAGKPAIELSFHGNPAETTDIFVRYSDTGYNNFQRLGQLYTAGKLAFYNRWRLFADDRNNFMEEMKRLTVYAYTALQLEVTTKEKIALAEEKAAAEAQVEIERMKREREEERHEFQRMVDEVNRTVNELKENHLHIIAGRMGVLRAMAARYPQTEDNKIFFNRINKYATEIEQLAREGMRKEPPTNKEELSLDDVLKDVIRIVEPEYQERVHFRTKYEPTITILADRKQIKTALYNLMNNAADASQIGATTEYPGEVVIEAQPEPTEMRQYTRIIITQTGYLSEHNAKRLNNGEPFTTKGKEGSGVGGPSTKRIIEDKCNGSIEYFSSDAPMSESGNKRARIELII